MIPKTFLHQFSTVCAVALAVASMSSAVSAQDAEADPQTEDAAPRAGEPYFREDVGDWRIRCVGSPIEGQEEVCQLYQLLVDSNQNPVSEFTILPAPEDENGAVIATIVTPLETLLPPGLRMSIDGTPEQSIPFTWCSNIGCYARFRLAAPDVDALRAGNSASIAITPLAAPDQQVTLTSSLTGFTRALETITSE